MPSGGIVPHSFCAFTIAILFVCGVPDAATSIERENGLLSRRLEGLKMRRVNEVPMRNYFKHFVPYSSSGHADPGRAARESITYIVITGRSYEDRAELVWLTWGRRVPSPHKLMFVSEPAALTTVGNGPLEEAKYSYTFDSKPERMIPLRFSNGTERYRVIDVIHEMPPYRRSQLKWLDAILHLGLSGNAQPFEGTDWYVFLDDDTFIHHDAMLQLLSEYDASAPLLIGKGGKDCYKMCGGAGFAISRSLLRGLCDSKGALVEAFFAGYHSNGELKHHSDVVISNFVLDKKVIGGGEFIRRLELKNFSPAVAAKWLIRQGGYNSTGLFVSFHKIEDSEDYIELYLYFKKNYNRG